MQGLIYILIIAIFIGSVYGIMQRGSAKKKQIKANTAFLSSNQYAMKLDKPCRIRVYCDLADRTVYRDKVIEAGYYFSLNGGEKQHIKYGKYIEFETVQKNNILDGFGGGNGFAGSSLGMAVDSYQFKATSGGFIQLSSKLTCEHSAGLAGFTSTTWHNNISIQQQEME